VLDTYITYDSDITVSMDLLFTTLFTMEALLKVINGINYYKYQIIAFGFIYDPYSYLSDSWSQLDFFIVIVSWADLGLKCKNIVIYNL
jgi:hypothetical protein